MTQLHAQAMLVVTSLLIAGCGPSPSQGRNIQSDQDLFSSSDAPPDRSFTLERVDFIQRPYSTPGCSINDTSVTLSTDNKAMSLIFSNLQVQADPPAPGVRSRRQEKYCNLDLSFNVPQGWSYAIRNVDYRGSAILSQGNQAWILSTASFSRDREFYDHYADGILPGGTFADDVLGRAFLNSELFGAYSTPLNESFVLSKRLPDQELSWSPCDHHSKTLKLRQLITVENRAPDGIAFIGIDSLDGDFHQEYDIVWRKCEPGVTENQRLRPNEAVWTNDRGESILENTSALPERGQVRDRIAHTVPLRNEMGEIVPHTIDWGIEILPPPRPNAFVRGRFPPILLTQTLTPHFLMRINAPESALCSTGSDIYVYLIDHSANDNRILLERSSPIPYREFFDWRDLSPWRGKVISIEIEFHSLGDPLCDSVILNRPRISTTADF